MSNTGRRTRLSVWAASLSGSATGAASSAAITCPWTNPPRHGRPLHPDTITRRFTRLVATCGLPPIRLHDLRHGAACLAHAAGADRPSSSNSATPRSRPAVLPAAQRQSAAATAKLVRKAANAKHPAKPRRGGKAGARGVALGQTSSVSPAAR